MTELKTDAAFTALALSCVLGFAAAPIVWPMIASAIHSVVNLLLARVRRPCLRRSQT
jgi:hypothetical protein